MHFRRALDRGVRHRGVRPEYGTTVVIGLHYTYLRHIKQDGSQPTGEIRGC